MKKVRLWALVSVMMAFAIVFTVCNSDEQNTPDIPELPGADSAPYFVTNNFAQDSSTAFVVQWHNAKEIEKQTLQIVKEDGDFASARSIIVTGELFDIAGIAACPNPTGKCSGPVCNGIGNYAARNIFRAEVSGLDPATKYKYRVGAPDFWSDTFYHLTSGGSNTGFSFTVVADTQDTNFLAMRNTLQAAETFDSDNRFFLHAGDVVDYIGLNRREIENYTNVANTFNTQRPIVTTQGNHDTYHNKSGDQYIFGEATVYNAFTVFPDNGFSKSHAAAHHNRNRSDSYYFYYNRVLIVMLNTMATQNATGTSEPVHTAQANWLREVLQNDKNNNLSNYRIVVTHIPPFAGRGSSSDSEPWLVSNVRSAYARICTEFDVDIFFAGHDHVYTRSDPIKIESNTALSGIHYGPTAGGTIYSIAGSTGPKLYDFRNLTGTTNVYISQSYPIRFDRAGISPGVFVNVKVTDEKMTVTANRLNANAPLDTYEVTKKR